MTKGLTLGCQFCGEMMPAVRLGDTEAMQLVYGLYLVHMVGQHWVLLTVLHDSVASGDDPSDAFRRMLDRLTYGDNWRGNTGTTGGAR